MRVCILSGLFVFFGFFSPSFAQETSVKTYTYQVYAGGIHVVEAKLRFDNASKYDVNLEAKTIGWLGKLVPWEGSFKTSGMQKDGVYMPLEHESQSTWKEEVKTKTFTYDDGDVVSLVIQEDGKKPQTPEIEKDLVENTVDVLSATLNVMRALPEKEICQGEADIFDGSRRFTMTFRDKGEAELTSSRYNIYDGKARYCSVEIEPKGGKWHDKPRGWLSIQEQGREKGTLPSLWMGHVDGFEYSVPVKIQVKTDYGTLMMHLVDVD